MPDTTGKNASGKMQGRWEFVTPEELKPNYSGAGKAVGADKARAQVTFPELAVLKDGAFSVDVILRWSRGGGFFLRIGEAPAALALGVLHRGPGQLQLRVPVKKADGTAGTKLLDSSEIYREAGPVRFDEFYTYSLVFDGKETFRLLIDGKQVFEGKLDSGTSFVASPRLAVGQVADWNNYFSGDIAAVRVSQGLREYTGPAGAVAFDSRSKHGWTFDAGTSESPVEPGAIRLSSATRYKDDPKLGFGWIDTPSTDFDAWYVAGRYAPTPEMAFAKSEHKIVDFLQRDGAVLEAGPIFQADVPDGVYWVSVEVGNNRGASNVKTMTANGVVLGQDLRTNANLHGTRIVGRTARGVVQVSGGKGLLIEAQTSPDKGEVPVKSIEILPYEPLPVVWKDGKLQWQGKGSAPAALDGVSQALAVGDVPKAVTAARGISDPFVKANVLSVILGQPRLPVEEDKAVAMEIRQLLIGVLRQNPNHGSAAWLFDSTERFRHALLAYLDNSGTEVVYGSRFGVWVSTINQGLQLRPEDPEYWEGRFLGAASLWQMAVQGSAFDMNGTSDAYIPEKRASILGFDAPGYLFREVIAAYPDFRIARIMLGEKLPVKTDWTPPANAPAWAVLQQELLQRILDVAHYWVNERMDAQGLLGGGLGDDVEVLRWFTPGVVLADDEATSSGWKRLADAAWKSTSGAGYSPGMDDVEHSSEPTGDPLPMLALIDYGKPGQEESLKRLTKTQPIFRDIWTTVTPDGYRMFKGYHFNATKIEREGDVPYNIRAIKPLLWAAWADPTNTELKDLLVAYTKNWRDAIMTEFDGKPKGIVPLMIKLDRQRAREEGTKNWVAAGYSTYAYPTGYSDKVYDLMLAAYALSGDKSFLEPITFGLEALRGVPENDRDPAKYEHGSFDWALRAGAKNLGLAGSNYRLMTGDHSFDDVLLAIAPAYMRFLIMAGRDNGPAGFEKAIGPVTENLKKALAKMNTNPELRTTMIKSTDRIYVTGSLIVNSMATGAVTAAAGLTSVDDDLRGGEFVWPTFQITWRGTGAEVSALVREASPTGLDVQLYSFSEKARTLSPQVWRLAPGTYEVALAQTDGTGCKTEKEISKKTVEIKERGESVDFELPPKVPARLTLTRK